MLSIGLRVLVFWRTTFYKVYKKKSTGSFQSTPYVVALASAMLWLYYALLSHNVLLLTINTSTCVLESSYLVVFLFYASKKVRVSSQTLFSSSFIYFHFWTWNISTLAHVTINISSLNFLLINFLSYCCICRMESLFSNSINGNLPDQKLEVEKSCI